jgi:hypothetical protein
MTIGALFTHRTAWIAFLLYATGLAAWLTGRPRAARLAWTSGLCIYLTHVAAAFQFRHHWGGGLYFNYAFTAPWVLDVIWIWWSPETYRRRRRWIALVIHGFMAFMFFNATVIFVSGWVRWLGLMVTIVFGILWLRTRSAPID